MQHGGSGNGQSGRSNNHNSNRVGRHYNNYNSRSVFKVNTPDMNSHFFECYKEYGDCTQFLKTLEVLGEYAAKKVKYPEGLKIVSEDNMIKPEILEPPDLPSTATKWQEVIWEASLKSYSSRVEDLHNNFTTLYAVI
jgi:hypothetical protein